MSVPNALHFVPAIRRSAVSPVDVLMILEALYPGHVFVKGSEDVEENQALIAYANTATAKITTIRWIDDCGGVAIGCSVFGSFTSSMSCY